MSNANIAALFEPVTLGNVQLKNRVLMAPMTRSRANAENIHNSPLTSTYYAQRASAGLMISEATAVAKMGAGYPNIPGLWNDAQQAAQRQIVEAVHAKGGKLFIQLFHTGRIGHSTIYGAAPLAPSAIAPAGQVMAADYSMQPFETPQAMTQAQIREAVQQFVQAAQRAVHAGANGVELHAANGYLIDQFLRDGSNRRTDEYGGTLEKRLRFLLEVARGVSQAIGAARVGVRLSPTGNFNDMHDSDPATTFTAAAEALKPFGLAYLHIIETPQKDGKARTRDLISQAMQQAFDGPVVLNGGYTAESGAQAIQQGWAAAIAFGAVYIANPDLPERFRHGVALAQPDTSTFYVGGDQGYTTYPTAVNSSR